MPFKILQGPLEITSSGPFSLRERFSKSGSFTDRLGSVVVTGLIIGEIFGMLHE
jgi:hypothetical protein